MSGGTQDSGISIPALPPPTEGSVLQRKALDTQPYIFKTSDRLLNEAEISRDIANKQWDAGMVKYTAELNQRHGMHLTVETVKYEFLHSPDPRYTPELIEALNNYEDANKKYNAALAATGDKEYERKARIFESASVMYADMGATEASGNYRECSDCCPCTGCRPKALLTRSGMDCRMRDSWRVLADSKKTEIKDRNNRHLSYFMGGRDTGGGKISSQKKLRIIASNPMIIAMMALIGIFAWFFLAL